MTKVTLGLGTVLFVISSLAFVIGGAELDSALEEVTPNSVGYEYWTGDTSTEFNGELKWSSVYFVFVEEGYEPTMGARPLKRLFENKLKKPLSKKILFEDMKNLEVTVKLVDGEINIETNKPKEL